MRPTLPAAECSATYARSAETRSRRACRSKHSRTATGIRPSSSRSRRSWGCPRYIALNIVERFERIPYDCYVNFLADYLEGEKGATHKGAPAAWKRLTLMDAPKNYRSWKRFS